MKNVISIVLVLAGLTTAVLLAAAGMRTNRTTIKLAGKAASLKTMDERARPCFGTAEKNIPQVVAELSGTEAFLNLCALAVADKVTGSDKLERKIASVIGQKKP